MTTAEQARAAEHYREEARGWEAYAARLDESAARMEEYGQPRTANAIRKRAQRARDWAQRARDWAKMDNRRAEFWQALADGTPFRQAREEAGL